MKKKVLATFVASAAAFCLVACGGATEPEAPEAETQVEEAPAEDVAEEPAKEEADTSAVLEEYAKGLTSVAGTSFKLSGKYDETDGIVGSIQGQSGNLCYMLENDDNNLVTIDYTSDNNTLTVSSFGVNDDGEVEEISRLDIDNFIEFNDKIDIAITQTYFTNDKETIMIESNGLAYTYADGVKYNIRLIEVCDDGFLDLYFDDGLAGSGDEDITKTIREGFNLATGCDFSKDTFEDAFYNRNLLIKQENDTVLAGVSFVSETAKLADNGDWDGVNEIVPGMYDVVGGVADEVYWGEGTLSAQ
ncbi:MAG: hypothetical protein K6E79_04620 [Pseudobutyrivibrio sp.]|nr:hypothetical protein [Pseudobutyrivibrio sp.]